MANVPNPASNVTKPVIGHLITHVGVKDPHLFNALQRLGTAVNSIIEAPGSVVSTSATSGSYQLEYLVS